MKSCRMIVLIFLTQMVMAQESLPNTGMYFFDLSDAPIAEAISTSIISRVSEEIDILGFPLVNEAALIYKGGTDGEISVDDFRLSSFFSDIEFGDAEIIIATFFAVRGSNIFIQYNIYDVRTGIDIGGLVSRARTGPTLFTSTNDAVLALSEYLQDFIKNPYEYKSLAGKVEEIFLTGRQEGVDVFFADQGVGTIAAGELLVPFAPFQIGELVAMKLQKDGYHEESFPVVLDGPQVNIELDELSPAKRFALQSFYTLGLIRGAGVGLKVYLVPDNTFTYLGFHIHDALYNSTVNSDAFSTNYDFSFLIGQYLFFPPQSLIRMSIGIGIGVVKTSVSPASVSDYNDIYINLGNPTIELNFGPLQIFMRGELKYALGLDNNLLGRNWIFTALGIPPVSFGVQVQW